jgi:hypothetical protein
MADGFEHIANVSGAIGAASTLGTIVAGASEGITLGGDTPFTVAFGSMASFFGYTSFGASALAIAFNRFASGNFAALQNFDFSHLESIAASAAASKIPGVAPYAEFLGRMTEQAAALAQSAQEACP